MRLAIACGGTGGHFFPGLATAEALRARGHDVTLWLAGKGVESVTASAWNGPVEVLVSKGFEGRAGLRHLHSAWSLYRAVMEGTRRMRRAPPSALLAMGAYASVGPLGAAWRLGIPFVLHESNVVPGRAIRLFSRGAAAVAGAFAETGFHLKRRDFTLTGTPLRPALAAAAHAARGAVAVPHPPCVLVMGGSAGAQRLNELMPEALGFLRAAGETPAVVHLAGRGGDTSVLAAYARHGVPAEVLPFTHDMAALYARATLAVCRSGAATCAELGAFGVPALLVPYPFAVSDHQTANARSLERAGAADVVPESSLTAAWLADYLGERLRHRERLREMRAAALSRAPSDAAGALADLVERVGRGGRGH